MADLLTYHVDPIRRLDIRYAAAALACWDLFGIIALALVLHGSAAVPTDAVSASAVVVMLGVNTLLWLVASRMTGLYASSVLSSAKFPIAAIAVTGCLICGPMVLAAGFGANPPGISGKFLVMSLSTVILWFTAGRVFWATLLGALLRRGFCVHRALVLAGSLSAARIVAAQLERRAGGRLRAAASIPMPGSAGGASMSWIEHTIRSHDIQKIFIAERAGFASATNTIAFELLRICADVTILPKNGEPYRVTALAPEISRLGDPGSLSRTQSAIKRASDIIIAIAALIVTLPAMLLIALAIKLDSPGPIFFCQDRRGINNTVFRIRKFRTMYCHMEDRVAMVQTTKNDKRVTRVGRFLRKSSFDEFPQVLNVLLGDMSIVGPRPHALGMTVAGHELEALVDDYNARHTVKPGITGWAQVNGCRGELETKRALWRRIALDAYYIRYWSLRLDAMIILRTAAMLAGDRHAY